MTDEFDAKSMFPDPDGAARRRLQDLIEYERRRAQAYISSIKRREPQASADRIAFVIMDRWTQVVRIEGGVTGVLGFIGIPLNLLMLTYCQVALVVSIAEAYSKELSGEKGEEVLLELLAQVHGVNDLVRNSPRLLGSLAAALTLRYGLGTLGRLIPLISAPISAKLNEQDMRRLGQAAMRRFGNVVMLPG